MFADEDDAVLSDVDNDEDPSTVAPSNVSAADQRLRDLLAELDNERRVRKAAEDTRVEMEREIVELKQFGDYSSTKLRNLEAKVDAQRPVIIDHLNHISKAYEQINEIVRIADDNSLDQSDSLDSSFMWEEMSNIAYFTLYHI